MNMNKEKLLRQAERVLKRTNAYQSNREMETPDEENYKMAYLLAEGSIKAPERVLAYASNDDYMLLFHPMEEPVYEILLDDWQFCFDGDLFQYLEGGCDLVAMTLEAHAGVWYEINEYHDTDGISCTTGMQKYLHYCKRHGVTKELLADKEDYDGMDVMTLYDRQAIKGRVENPQKDFER